MSAAIPPIEPDLDLLESARVSEKEQALVYRALAARAEATGLGDLAQRFHDLHADEQHHLSRLTARLLELRRRPPDLPGTTSIVIPLDGWEEHVRRREEDEIRRYAILLREPLDAATRRLIESILAVEENHLAELGGKWTMA
jgi:rubrerythrin